MEQYSLYDGDVTLEFDPYAHEYFVGDRKIPNVTSIVDVIDKPRLGQWRLNEAIKYLAEEMLPGTEYDEIEIAKLLKYAELQHVEIGDRAKTIGHVVHSWIENYIGSILNGTDVPEMPYSKDALVGVLTFQKWVERNDVQFLASERKIYSPKYNYTGTMDALCMYEGKMTVMDFKTSKRHQPEHALQVAAYAKAFEEETGEKVERLVVLRIPKERALTRPRIGLKEYTGINQLFKTFRACIEIHRWQNT